MSIKKGNAGSKKIRTKPALKGFHAPTGMKDILPFEQPYWDKIRDAINKLALFYNFHRIDTPSVEPFELFLNTLEEDINLEKEVYLLKSRGGETLALRPEATVSVARAYMEHTMGRIAQPQKLFYEGAMFKYRGLSSHPFRQFTQGGFEIMGGFNDPIYDAQIVLIFTHLLNNLKIKDWEISINSVGCKVCRPFYKKQLQMYYERYRKELCLDCQSRLDTDPLRILGCKKKGGCEKLKEQAPNFLDRICLACTHHFQAVLEYLDELKIPYNLDNRLMGERDYCNRMAFKFLAKGEAGEVYAAGGRYDYLMETIGGRVTQAVGGRVTYEPVVQELKRTEPKMAIRSGKKVFVIHVGDLAKRKALKLIEDFRNSGLMMGETFGKEALKAQLKIAEKEGYTLALILGQKEIYEDSVILRDLRNSAQETVALSKIVDEVKKRFKAHNE